MQKETLKAVHDDDLEEVLRSLGLLHDFRADKLKCKFCKGVITWDSLHSLFPDSGAIKVVCNNVECVKALLGYLEERG